MTETAADTRDTAQALQRTDLDQYLYRPWQDGYVLGRGMQFITGLQVASALAPISQITRSTASYKTMNMRFIRTTDDFAQEVGASGSGSGNVEGVTIKGSVEYLNKVRYSSAESTLLASYVERQADFDRLTAPTLSSTAEARIADADDFRRVYGDYYLSGQRRQAEFTAVYVLRARDATGLNSFHASFGASTPDVFSAEGSAKLVQAASSHGIEIDVFIAMSPTRGNPPAPDGKGAGSYTPASVLETLEWFKQSADMGYQVAEFTHYSALNADFERTIDVPPSFFTKLHDLDEFVVEVQRLYDATPVVFQRTLERQLDDLVLGVRNSRSQFEHQPELLDDLLETAASLQEQLGRIAAFFESVRLLSYSVTDWTGRQPRSAGINRNGDQTPIPRDLGVTPVPVELRCSEDWDWGHKTGSVTWSRPGARIMTVDVSSRWDADTRGTVTRFGGGIGKNHIDVHFEADLDRGLSWSVKLWYVDCDATS